MIERNCSIKYHCRKREAMKTGNEANRYAGMNFYTEQEEWRRVWTMSKTSCWIASWFR